jgi:hypothetical protein
MPVRTRAESHRNPERIPYRKRGPSQVTRRAPRPTVLPPTTYLVIICIILAVVPMVRNEDQDGHLRCFDHMDTILVFASNVNWRREKDRLPSKGKSHGPFEDIDSFVARTRRRQEGAWRDQRTRHWRGTWCGLQRQDLRECHQKLGKRRAGGFNPNLGGLNSCVRCRIDRTQGRGRSWDIGNKFVVDIDIIQRLGIEEISEAVAEGGPYSGDSALGGK